MSALGVVQYYYSLFGSRGVWLAMQARFQRKCVEVAVAVPGIKHPVHLRLRTSDVPTFEQVLVSAGYACALPGSPRVIVDAGANIGLASLFFANKYPEARILAIEPAKSNYRLLKANSAPYRTIIPVQGALWKNGEELNIEDSGLGEWGLQTTAAPAAEVLNSPSQEKAYGITLDKLMEQHDIEYIDLLKIDIEGSEKEVFESAGSWIKKVGVIAIELHDAIRPGCSQAFAAAVGDFERVGSRGETLFMARPGSMSGAGATMDEKGISSSAPKLRLPCKILRVVSENGKQEM
jgi:FkbM family methyltransferase